MPLTCGDGTFASMGSVSDLADGHFGNEAGASKSQQIHTNLLANAPALMQILKENYMTLVIRI